LVGSPERLRILEALKEGPKDRGYFIKLLNLWPQAVKYHVDILVNGDLVSESWSKTGRRKKIYTLTPEGKRELLTLYKIFGRYFKGLKGRIPAERKAKRRKKRP